MVELYGVIMCKNESTNITRSLESLAGSSGVFIYDTGSTDDTIKVIKNVCKRINLPVFIKQGTFVDFSTSRNVLLDFARDTLKSSKDKWLVLLDANETIIEKDLLISYLENVKDLTTDDNQFVTRDSVYLKQRWKTSQNGEFLDFKNYRCLRSDTTMRYKGLVHEYLSESKPELKKIRTDEIAPEAIIVYQDRTLDTTMSSETRWIRDKKIFSKEYKRLKNINQLDSRTVFYFAQTCKCLGDNDEAIQYYTERSTMGGFTEEVYLSFIELGKLFYIKYKLPLIFKETDNKYVREEKIREYENNKKEYFKLARHYYLEAFSIDHRAEPLLGLGLHYLELNKYTEAYFYIKMACETQHPVKVMLWYDANIYHYNRWHALGRVAFYVNKLEEGRDACLKCIEFNNNDIDKHNLAFYEKVMSENSSSSLNNEEKTKHKKEETLQSLISQNAELVKNYRLLNRLNYYDHYYEQNPST